MVKYVPGGLGCGAHYKIVLRAREQCFNCLLDSKSALYEFIPHHSTVLQCEG